MAQRHDKWQAERGRRSRGVLLSKGGKVRAEVKPVERVGQTHIRKSKDKELPVKEPFQEK